MAYPGAHPDTARLDALIAAPEVAQDPYPAYRALQAEAPVHWSAAWNAWVVAGYDDCISALRDHARFSSAGRLLELLDGLPPELQATAAPIREHFSTRGLIHVDPPDHQRLRSLISKAFSPRVIEAMRPRIEVIVEGLLDQVVDRGEMEVVADLAYPLPAIVIAELLGAPPEDRDRFRRWSDEIVAFQGTGRAIPEAVPRSASGITEMRAYLAELFEERRRTPHDDLLGNLVAVELEGQRLTTDELYSTCVTFLIGGHETTTSLIANGVWTLLRHPAQLAALREDPSLMGSAIEEILRFESPIQRTFRRVAQDTEFGGRSLRAGQIAIQLLGAANRDPEHFDEPDSFDIRRSPNRHIAFGSGIHFCIGAPLARLEATIALSAVLRRFPDLELATPAVTWQSEKALFRCVSSLPVRFGRG
ncbi:MAG: cytochrome P450 [Chloroflexi bacterium]|nr:cytochrome P450 [Chloroflexota bacterium]